MRIALGMLCGVTFGGGLALSGMTNPARVLGFLDVAGAWDPSLAFVMGAALLVTTPAFYWIARKQRTVFGERVELPTSTQIDSRLVGGAALFGVGWGLVGLCPGPSLAALALAPSKVILFTGSLLAGILLHDRIVAGKPSQKA